MRRGEIGFGSADENSSTTAKILGVTFGIWLLSGLIWMVCAFAQNLRDPILISARGMIVDLLGALLCFGDYVLLERCRGAPMSLLVVLSIMGAVLQTAIYMFATYVVFFVIAPVAPAPHGWLVHNIPTFVAVIWTFLAWFGIYFSLRFGVMTRDARAAVAEAENRVLRYQLDPHFLFNIHNGLATLIHDGRTVEAEKVVLSLSAFLRRSLERSISGKVSLAVETAAMRDYMNLELTRFGGRLRFIELVEPAAEDALLPSFILQPLLENAIKHGLGSETEMLTVTLGAERRPQTLCVWVQDDGCGAGSAAAPKLGVGLCNVRERLRLIYGGSAVLTLEPGLRGYRAMLELPWSTARDKVTG